MNTFLKYCIVFETYKCFSEKIMPIEEKYYELRLDFPSDILNFRFGFFNMLKKYYDYETCKIFLKDMKDEIRGKKRKIIHNTLSFSYCEKISIGEIRMHAIKYVKYIVNKYRMNNVAGYEYYRKDEYKNIERCLNDIISFTFEKKAETRSIAKKINELDNLSLIKARIRSIFDSDSIYYDILKISSRFSRALTKFASVNVFEYYISIFDPFDIPEDSQPIDDGDYIYRDHENSESTDDGNIELNDNRNIEDMYYFRGENISLFYRTTFYIEYILHSKKVSCLLYKDHLNKFLINFYRNVYFTEEKFAFNYTKVLGYIKDFNNKLYNDKEKFICGKNKIDTVNIKGFLVFLYKKVKALFSVFRELHNRYESLSNYIAPLIINREYLHLKIFLTLVDRDCQLFLNIIKNIIEKNKVYFIAINENFAKDLSTSFVDDTKEEENKIDTEFFHSICKKNLLELESIIDFWELMHSDRIQNNIS